MPASVSSSRGGGVSHCTPVDHEPRVARSECGSCSTASKPGVYWYRRSDLSGRVRCGRRDCTSLASAECCMDRLRNTTRGKTGECDPAHDRIDCPDAIHARSSDCSTAGAAAFVLSDKAASATGSHSQTMDACNHCNRIHRTDCVNRRDGADRRDWLARFPACILYSMR